jgi:hypothetical protein
MADLKRGIRQRVSGLIEKVMPYFNMRENMLDIGGTVLFGGAYDFLGNMNFTIDNPIPNLSNGAGTVAGIYFIGKHLLEPGKKPSEEDNSRYNRGMTKSLLIACAATALGFYLKEHTNTNDYFVDLFENTLRYAGGFVVPILLYFKFFDPEGGNDRGGGDNDPQDDPDPRKDQDIPDPKEPNDSTPNDFLPKPIRDRMKPKLPEPSRN